jgi:outer membrane protein assembly factor BamE (lipoprotein component of BamABCDE complex)
MSGVMRAASLCGLLILVAGCASQQPSNAQKSMIGMSKADLRGCMGAPEASAVNGDTETWTYGSASRGKSAGRCKADLVMTQGRLTRIDYHGDAGAEVTKGGVCGFIVEKCARP